MTIFLRELKANRRALLLWCLCMVLGVAGGMSKYTAYSSGAAGNQVFQQLPYSVRALLGIGSFDVTRMSGFFILLYFYIELALGAHAAFLGSGILAKEELGKTTEFLMAKPVSRATVVSSKLFAAVLNAIVVNLVTLGSSLALAPAVSKGQDVRGEILTLFGSLFLVQLLFLGLGTLAAAYFRSPKAAAPAVTGILLVAFAAAEVTNLTDKLDFLIVLSPFKYFSFTRAVDGGGIEPLAAVITAMLALACFAGTFLFYKDRDFAV